MASTPPGRKSPLSPTGTATPPPALQNVGVIEAGVDEQQDNDSSLGDENASSTASIGSSIMRYREENGRTYHVYKDGQYLMPNDTREQERLDLQHHLFLLTFDHKLHLSPAGTGGHALHNVLDVGTGTGLWALDFADEHPQTQVIGVNLSPIQSQFVPPNLTFQVNDVEEQWMFHAKFDFIYSRMMTAALADWPRFFRQAYDNLAPGGWLETVDICPIACDDRNMKDDSALARWVTQLLDGTRKVSRPFDGALRYKMQMEEVGFRDVTQVVFKWPMNRWPKDPKLKEIDLVQKL
ncbi:hypothetical protein QQX98_006161 [Neonectria punicea]|uniref:S-adenosyl-L-methionine-dependent methyltransferase n=1 Tax=Neonectria punicea TaxID=979145 RepID=A0ABR1H2C6_9HYPO